MGDKTQIATVMLTAKYESLVAATAGTTLGMMLANVPAVLLGDKVVKKVPLVWVHAIAALVFAVLGVLVLAGVGSVGSWRRLPVCRSNRNQSPPRSRRLADDGRSTGAPVAHSAPVPMHKGSR